MQEGDEVIISVMEHHSNIVPWQLIAAKTGAVIKFAELNSDEGLDRESFSKLLSPRTKLVSLVHVSNTLGCINPIKEIAAEAHAVGAKVLVDACQSVPHMRIDVQDLGCDWLVASGHKVPYATLRRVHSALLQTRAQLLSPRSADHARARGADVWPDRIGLSLRALRCHGLDAAHAGRGGDDRRGVSDALHLRAASGPLRSRHPGYRSASRPCPPAPHCTRTRNRSFVRAHARTCAVTGVLRVARLRDESRLSVRILSKLSCRHVAGECVGLGAACDYLMDIGMDKIEAHEHAMTRLLFDALEDVPDLRIYGPRPGADGSGRAALAAFNHKTIQASDMATFLDMEGVAIRSGHHCTQPLHRMWGASGSARASCYLYTTEEDIAGLARHLKDTIQMFANIDSMNLELE